MFLSTFLFVGIYFHTVLAAGIGDSNIKMEVLLETKTTKYFLSKEATDAITAKMICENKKSHLLTIESKDEDSILADKLKTMGLATGVWMDGIMFSNSSISNLYLWSTSHKPFRYANFDTAASNEKATNPDNSERPKRGEMMCQCDCQPTPTTPNPTPGDGTCLCPCPNVTPPPTPCDCSPKPPPIQPPQQCQTPICKIKYSDKDKPCVENLPRKCDVVARPVCETKDRKCHVECKGCYIASQPVCTLEQTTDERCTLSKDYIKCTPKPPTCTVISDGSCTAIQGKCIIEDPPTCNSIIKPCKDRCTDYADCQSVSPHQCTKIPPKCATPPCPPCDTGTCVCDQKPVCTNETIQCPPPVTKCSRPFVDCSPEICQSSVRVCTTPTKIRCPPPQVKCEEPVIVCDPVTEEECEPEPDVYCNNTVSYKIHCSKPKIVCPDALLQCDPIITTCGQATHQCSAADITCATPDIVCEGKKTCPLGPNWPTPPQLPCTSCSNSIEALQRVQRDTSDVETFETTQCIAMKKDIDFRWEVQSCDKQFQFICEKPNTIKRKPNILDWLV